MDNCIIYSRVSTEDQDNVRQIQELKEYAVYKKYNLLAVFEEKISGMSKAAERIEFAKLLKFIDANEIKHLLIWELSRLGRSMIDVLNTVELFYQKKINIYCKKEALNTLNDKGEKDPTAKLILGILSSLSEIERENILVRSRSGIRENVREGGSGTGILKAYGYKKVGKKLFIDPEEAEIVKMIFQKYLEGLGTVQIAKYLNSQHIPTRYNKVFGDKEVKLTKSIVKRKKKGSEFEWVDGTIHTMLKNPIYKGKRRHKGETFTIDAIIDEQTFDKVQALLKSKYNKKDINRKYTNIFHDKIICGKCGRTYFLHKRANGKDSAYKCLSKRYFKSCGNVSISIDKLNNAVYNMMGHRVREMGELNKEQIQKKLNMELKNLKIKIENTKTAIQKNNREQLNLVKLKIGEQISEENYTLLNTKILAEKKSFEEQLEKFQKDIEANDKMDKQLNHVTNIDFSDTELFKEYISSSLEYIKIDELPRGVYDFADKAYTNKQDKMILVSIKYVFREYLNHFVISQRSDVQFIFLKRTYEKEYRVPIPKFTYKIGNKIVV